MLADMSRLPSIPSRPAPHHTYTSYSPYQRGIVAPSQPDVPPPSQHHRPRDSEGNHSHAPQLPSLRTLLEPELLENKGPEAPLRSAAVLLAHGSSARYGSASPTLKRRHDFDSYSHEQPENNAITPRVAPVLRHAPYAPTIDNSSAAFTAPGPSPGSRQSDLSRHGNLARPIHNEPIGGMFRPSSTTSAMSASSDPLGTLPNQAFHDDPMDIVRPMRRRTEGTSRAPVRSSRCVGQREVPGEGLCYVYEDGSFCRAIIDGEAVNPSWGITKAGKPRKRLAQACLTCREKKIKCEPGYPKCHQCAKSQRACRGGLSQQSMSNASGETSPSSSSILFKNQSAEHVNPVAGPDKSRSFDEQHESSRTAEPWNVGPPSKPRIFRPHSVGKSLRDMSVHSMDSDWSGSVNTQDPEDPRRGSHNDPLALQWEHDPYETDARLTMHFLDLYFRHAGRATYGMFPQRPFLRWVETNRDKNQDHLMLLYSVLAMGSVFAPDQDRRSIGNRFAAVAAYAAEKRFGKFTLQLCQTRLLLALYNFARGKSQGAWDLCGAGLRAISALKLNTEQGIKELPDTMTDLDYGFDRPTLEECCRRTFWSGFLMDRYNGFCGGTLCVINIEDTFLHLPCSESMFEASTPSDTPYFDYDLFSQQSPPGPLGHMSYLTLISVIWGDVLTFTTRSIHRPESSYERLYDTFYAQTYERLEAWHAMLPANLQNSLQNLDTSIMEGYAGTFLSLHALYTTTIIRLNRHVRVHILPNNKLARNIHLSFRAASQFLSIMHSLSAPSRQRRLPPNTAADFLFSTPFPGYALMFSIDVLTAAGTVSTLPNLIETLGPSLSCIDELANFWASARAQHKAIANRVKQLTDIAVSEEQGARNGNYGHFWKINDSLETAFGNDDGVYKVNEQMLFDVVGELTARQ
ncbi:hypothetical protein CC80DRAFT_550611 [Byssothecium circinans]|uniref:Zn(2)-C6 fungal-type domain-containing protein n=1 Tax=Byssothecium circinans TaxID=147558 RepID=A0A6A5TN64_9PLEO|nr:hypothetical protein CC80DRAFT_550611 [Byssothecium circinans]